MIRYGILLFICSICVFTQGFAQCFASPGNPVGGTANMGTMQKNSVRIASNFQHSYSDTYFEGHSKYTGPKNSYTKRTLQFYAITRFIRHYRRYYP